MLLERFIKYVKIDSNSNPKSQNCPSSEVQWNIAKVIAKDLEDMGLQDVSIDENCYVMATLPSNSDKKVDTIGFIAHMDTAPSYNGSGVNPKVIKSYDGGDIFLNENTILSPIKFPSLKKYIGNDLVTTDGTTLLGADDKAGVVEIIEAIDYFIKNPDKKHGEIKICFTPDEEIGRGANLFNVEKFGCKFAYTVDGGELGELEYENFNAASANISIKGRDIHPGTAKNSMINSLILGMELNSLLPVEQRPEYTDGYEGFFLLNDMKGDVEDTTMSYIIRDHSKEKFEEKKILMKKAVEYLQAKYKDAEFKLELKDSYYNMKEMIEPVFEIVELAKKSMIDVGITPIIRPIRGGTDGSKLSFMGLPCPNIFTGGHNFHGKYEYISVNSMEKAKEVIIKIIENHYNNN